MMDSDSPGLLFKKKKRGNFSIAEAVRQRTGAEAILINQAQASGGHWSQGDTT